MTDGIIMIDKPANMTSFGVVARIRRVLSEQAGKKIKVGHTGTLDPFATGLMILTIGKECKNAEHYSKLDKVYETTLRLGEVSSTGDSEGEIANTNSTTIPSREAIEEAVGNFIGEIQQTPPIYSAIKIGGRRAYKLAREGKTIEMPTRTITIHQIEILRYEYPELELRVHVSSGTYIRSLAVDMGEVLGVGAYCAQLRRTKIAQHHLKGAQQLSDFGIL